MKKLSLILLFITLIAIVPGVAAQESTVDVTAQDVSSTFRDNVTFTLSADSDAEIVDVDLLYKIAGQVATSRNQADFVPGTSVDAEYVLNQNEPGNYFPPGTELQYWWKLTDADGDVTATERQALVYLDETHNWDTLENERLTLYWYEGDDEFSQNLYDRANASLDTLEEDLGVMLEEPIKIFIYADHTDFMDAYFPSGQEWAGGAAFDEHGVVMMTVEPDEPEWGTIITTHEMTHLVIHRATDNFFTGDLTLPRWLDEGIAVYTSGELHTRRDFQQALNYGLDNNQLFTLRTLSSPFSSDSDEAVLSYAQSGAVVEYIVDTYGADAVSELLEALSEGALYDEALEQAIGLDTIGLDNAFRESKDLPPLPPLPEVVSEPAAEEEAEAEPTPGSDDQMEQAVVEDTSEEEPEESIEMDAVEAAGDTQESTGESADVPPAAETSDEGANPFGVGCCLSGIIPLLFVGLLLYGFRFMRGAT
jgi:hypothetical protein